MRTFDIDVSGEDILSKNYTICVADCNGLIKGFKFNNKLVSVLSSKYGQGVYKYKKSKKGKSAFKIRLYLIVIYYLFESLELKEKTGLKVCRDFFGRENDIKNGIFYFLKDKLEMDLDEDIFFGKLSSDSNAHKYAFLMRHDTKNKFDTYVNIKLVDFERWLKK
jgi:hypothetical protein